MSLKQRMPFLRWSVLRMAVSVGAPNIEKTGQIGDGRETAAAEFVIANARKGDIDDVIATIDKFAYENSYLINVGDEKGEILDAAVRRANTQLALELGTYCGYGALRIARAAPDAKVYSVELAEANAAVARRIWAHAGVTDRVTCVVGTIGRRWPYPRRIGQRARLRRRQARLPVHRPPQGRLPARPAEHPGSRLAAPRIHRRRR